MPMAEKDIVLIPEEVLRLARITSANQEQIKVKIDNRIPDITPSELSEFVSDMIDVIGIYLCLINSHSNEKREHD